MLHIKPFKPETIEDGKVSLIIGKRGTGKSVLLKDLMYYKRHFSAGVVMSGTEEGNGYYKGWVPDVFVYNDFNRDVIAKIIERQKKLSNEGKARPVFVVLDDCLYDKKILRDKAMRAVFMNGRHWKIHLWCTAQYLMDVPPDIRMQIDYVFVFRDNAFNNRKKLHSHFFGVFEKYDDFSTVMTNCTENYECLVLNNAAHSNDIESTVFWYKAKIRNNFRMGSDEMWRFHTTNYNPRHDEGGAVVRHAIVVKKK